MSLSVNVGAIRKRIKRLPKIGDDLANTSSKRDALLLVKYYREGVGNGSFSLPSLQRQSIQQKIKKGYTKPQNPLYGLGIEGRRTLSSTLRVYKTWQGWRVKWPNKRHHSSKITVAQLAYIHEHGLIIQKGNNIIRIPARPAFTMAYKRLVSEISSKDPSTEVQRACAQYLMGNDSVTGDMMRQVQSMEAVYGTKD